MDGRTIRLIERRLEYIGNTQLLSYPLVLFASTHGEVFGLENINAAEQNEWQTIGAGNMLVDFYRFHEVSNK